MKNKNNNHFDVSCDRWNGRINSRGIRDPISLGDFINFIDAPRNPRWGIWGSLNRWRRL